MVATVIELPRLERNESANRLASASRPLIAVLRQLAAVVSRLSDAQYTQKPVGVVESSVGAHVRHCLDHVRSLLTAAETGELNYDHRRRGTPVETSRCCALSEIDELISLVSDLSSDVIDRDLSMSICLCSDDPAISVQTSFGRELAYTLTHTIHHNALIGAMVRTLGGWLPERFGYAPSTVRHLADSTCAR